MVGGGNEGLVKTFLIRTGAKSVCREHVDMRRPLEKEKKWGGTEGMGEQE